MPMSDILRVTTPLVNKSQVVDARRNVENLPQFNLQDLTKVIQTSPDTELLSQNNGMLGDEKTSALLLDLLKDPAVTVTYLKNISLLQELFSLLPANNKVMTEEIEEVFTSLLISPEEIVPEMLSQESGSTSFRGEIFDIMRGALDSYAKFARDSVMAQSENAGSQIMKYSAVQKSVIEVLKALSLFSSREDSLNAVANNLEHLAKSLSPSRTLSDELYNLSAKFRAPDARAELETLKKEIQVLFDKVDDSILLSPKISKTMSLTIYNLSRYNDNAEYLATSVERLKLFLPKAEDRDALLESVSKFVEKNEGNEIERSKVLDKLTEIISRQMESEDVLSKTGDKLEKIVQSLLSSPCNFTPLLHYIVPIQQDGLKSFMEMWINPNGEQDSPERSGGFKDNYHFFLVFDVGRLGRFNMDVYIRDKTVDYSLFCPPPFTYFFASTTGEIGKLLNSMGYKSGDVRVADLERDRSLMEVFRSLPYRRTGVDVKI